VKKLTLSILTAIIIFPCIDSFAAFTQNTQGEFHARLEQKENRSTRKKLISRYRTQAKYQRQLRKLRNRSQAQARYQRKLSQIRADVKMNAISNQNTRNLVNQITVGGDTSSMEYRP
jgi:hypothetical protein